MGCCASQWNWADGRTDWMSNHQFLRKNYILTYKVLLFAQVHEEPQILKKEPKKWREKTMERKFFRSVFVSYSTSLKMPLMTSLYSPSLVVMSQSEWYESHWRWCWLQFYSGSPMMMMMREQCHGFESWQTFAQPQLYSFICRSKYPPNFKNVAILFSICDAAQNQSPISSYKRLGHAIEIF